VFNPMMGIKKFVQMCDFIVGTYNYDVTSVDVIPNWRNFFAFAAQYWFIWIREKSDFKLTHRLWGIVSIVLMSPHGSAITFAEWLPWLITDLRVVKHIFISNKYAEKGIFHII